MQIEKNKVVSIDYTLTDPQGQVIDSSKGRGPLSYLAGVGGIIPGLEKAMEGKAQGDHLDVTIAPADAYGEKDPGLVQSVPKNLFRGVENIQPGMQFQAQGPSGPARMVTVVAVQEETITIDANHPLAGMPLHFVVDVVEVREASPEELSHGHVHGNGDGGHAH
jgi:FKBP-type peptidyl-prolyl cis-trans isomerase SlyD